MPDLPAEQRSPVNGMAADVKVWGHCAATLEFHLSHCRVGVAGVDHPFEIAHRDMHETLAGVTAAWHDVFVRVYFVHKNLVDGHFACAVSLGANPFAGCRLRSRSWYQGCQIASILNSA